MSSTLLGTSFIGYSRSTSTQCYQRAVNPSTSQKLDPEFMGASADEVEKALSLAAGAFPVFSNLSGKSRAEFLRAIASRIESVVDDIAARGPQETGLPEGRMRGETARTTGQLRMFADLIEEGSWVDARIEHAIPDRQPAPKPDLRSMLRPLGPVAVFCAGNFPLAFSVAGGDTASALAAGCPVIVIAHQGHPGVAEIVANAVVHAAQETNMPEGVFSLLFGGGRTVGQTVVRSPAIQAVGFTGSRAGGTALMAIAAARPLPIPVYAEMSSINPLVILPGALAAGETALAEAYFASLTLGMGQFCTNPGLVFMPANRGDAFLARLKELVEDSTPGVMLTPTICDSYKKSADGIATAPDVETLARCGKEPGPGQGASAVFTVALEDFVKNPELQSEVFGPAALVVRGETSAIEAAMESLEGQLTATLHATEEELAANPGLVFALQKRAGRLIFNGFPTGVEVCSSMVHGGPFPATSDGRSTSVGTSAILRFVRPVAWQDFPDAGLPQELQDANPLGIKRME